MIYYFKISSANKKIKLTVVEVQWFIKHAIKPAIDVHGADHRITVRQSNDICMVNIPAVVSPTLTDGDDHYLLSMIKIADDDGNYPIRGAPVNVKHVKAPVRKSTGRQSAARKSTARKPAVRKSAARKSAARKLISSNCWKKNRPSARCLYDKGMSVGTSVHYQNKTMCLKLRQNGSPYFAPC